MSNSVNKLTGNKNAEKPPDDRADSFIHARCKRSDKARWVKAAQKKGMKLTQWIVQILNDQS
jgi:predicted HicB family RNase H-like nuclease